ncbi:hypothetical protein EV421DRAFT_2034257 [Armillaria borealis]|uniref:F-box domain-containing protein n=1 Tax=Armillaria borealis TaxID=47425 RepID=A0AA39JMZ2_9AGAR|nr:hypothetical protein EV421DRAFT_2034257 [Armillaria borealis]
MELRIARAEPQKTRPWTARLSLELHLDIFGYLSPLDLVRYGRVNKTARAAIAFYIASKFRKLLSGYFNPEGEILQFRHLQAKFGVLISGSTVVQLLDRVKYPDSDLDIYAGYAFSPRKDQKERFVDFCSGEYSDNDLGPLNWPSPEVFGYECRGMADVWNFHRGDKKIQLITAERTPMEIILSFHSTAPMNVISHSMVCCLFPKATFKEKRALVVSRAQAAGKQKYIDRGWRLFDSALAYDATNSRSEFQAGELRWVGDKKCLTLSFPDVESFGTSDRLLYSLQANSWRLKYDKDSRVVVEHDVIGENGFAYCVADGHMFESILRGTSGFDDLSKTIARGPSQYRHLLRDPSSSILSWVLSTQSLKRGCAES